MMATARSQTRPQGFEGTPSQRQVRVVSVTGQPSSRGKKAFVLEQGVRGRVSAEREAEHADPGQVQPEAQAPGQVVALGMLTMRLIVMPEFHSVMATPSQLRHGRSGDKTSSVRFNERILFIDA